MSYLGFFYRAIGRRFSTILLTSTVGVFVYDFTINNATDAFWDYVSLFFYSHGLYYIKIYVFQCNKGKQWKDIKLTLGGAEEEE